MQHKYVSHLFKSLWVSPVYFERVCETYVFLSPGALEVGLLAALHATNSAGSAGCTGSGQSKESTDNYKKLDASFFIRLWHMCSSKIQCNLEDGQIKLFQYSMANSLLIIQLQ